MSYPHVLTTTAVTGAVALSGLVGFAVLALPASGASSDVSACTSVAVSLGPSEGAAGSTYQTLRLRNASTATCTVRGFPGVASVNADDIMIGWPAKHNGARAHTVTLGPGETAEAVLQLPDPGAFKRIDCLPHNVNRLRVRVGADRSATLLTWNHPECTTRYGRASIGSVH